MKRNHFINFSPQYLQGPAPAKEASTRCGNQVVVNLSQHYMLEIFEEGHQESACSWKHGVQTHYQEEWLVLDQLQKMMETMAHSQQILKGESYVTGSLVAVAVFRIRQGYAEVIECDDTERSIKSLAKVLLTNFDTQYAPACSDTGKVKYHRKDTIRKYKHYFGIHQYFFVASFLDPRVAPLLGDVMTPDDYNMLKSDEIDFMVTKIKANAKLFNEHALKQPSAPSAPDTQPPKNDLKCSQLKDKMFWGLNTKAPDASTATGNDSNHDDIALRAVCVS
jgi:hypothetical protein